MVASLKYFFSILRDIKNTIKDTKADPSSKNFIFFFAINKKNLKSVKSNTSNSSDVLLFIFQFTLSIYKYTNYEMSKFYGFNLFIKILLDKKKFLYLK